MMEHIKVTRYLVAITLFIVPAAAKAVGGGWCGG